MRSFIVLMLLTGCSHSSVVVGNARPVASSGNVNASGTVAAAVLITTVAIAAGQGASDPSTAVPAMAPEREIGEQDCTKPIDLTAGNLRCR